jgi:hypothetical protein
VSTIDDSGNPYRTTTWELASNRMDPEGTNNLWNLAERIQRRCDGVRGTNGDIQGYFSELQRFAD